MKVLKRLSAALIVIALLLAGIWFTAFTTVDYVESGVLRKVLISKRYDPSALQPGDIVLVELQQGEQSSDDLRRIGGIQSPDPTRKPSAGRAVARRIQEMDFTPTYFVSSTGLNTNSLVPLHEAYIKGKVIHVFRPANR